MLIIRVVSVIIMLLLMKCAHDLIGVLIKMITYEEYRLLKRIEEYRTTPNWTILDSDFAEFCGKDELEIHSILYDLHKEGLVIDTALLNNGTTHSVNITERGHVAMKEYKKKFAIKVVLWILSALAIAIITALVTIGLELVIL